MASFLTGAAVELVGQGMQALDMGIPVSNTTAKIINGARNIGLPVPPKSWFKNKSNKDKRNEDYEREKKTMYDKLESHVNGIIKVVKPVIELKQMVREGCCRSADRDSWRRAEQNSTPDDHLRYYTPQKCSSGTCVYSPADCNRVSSKTDSYKRRRIEINDNDDDSDDKITCAYCTESTSLTQLPCGRVICTKCDKARNRKSELNMPRKTRSGTKLSLPEAQDIIDLTQDSPLNVALRRSRNESNNDDEVTTIDPGDTESVHVVDVFFNIRPNTRATRNSQPAAVINLEETINLDETLNNTNEVHQDSISSTNGKKGLSCPICFENLADENIKPMTTPCGHIYCSDCLKKVTEAKKKCAICQRAITLSKCIRLHI